MARRPTGPLGPLGEEVAARFLDRQGLTIVERNLRSRLGEIDLIAREGATLVFVEVKAGQSARGDPPQARVDGRKRARLARLALRYLAARGERERQCRFDVVAVTLTGERSAPRIDYFRGAFLIDGWVG